MILSSIIIGVILFIGVKCQGIPSIPQNFTSPLIDPDVLSAPAFLNSTQFYMAINASIPFLPTPLQNNSTKIELLEKSQYHYPDFINYAIKIGNVTTTDEMAMFLAQVLYQSDGLRNKCDPACKDPSSPSCLGMNLGANVYGTKVNYYGRGYLWVQGQSAYIDCAKELFGNDSTLLTHPDSIRISEPLNWAVTSWYWKRLVKPYATSFGSTTKIIRPDHCNGNAADPKKEATNAWNIYVAILKILAPTTPPTSSFC